MARISFTEYSQSQDVLFSISIDSKIPKNSSAQLINPFVNELDLTDVNFGYEGGGNSSYHSRMMIKVLFYTY